MTEVSEFRYTEAIYFYRLPESRGKFLILLRDYTVSFRIDDIPTTHTVPAGFETDGPSVPYFIPKWVAQTGLSAALEAAVVHDHMREIQGPWSSSVAARIFRAGLNATSIGGFKAWYMYRAVTFGGPSWA